MPSCLYALALFSFFYPAALVVNAIPQPVAVGSRDSSIIYSPPGSWALAYGKDGFSTFNGSGVFMFTHQNADQAEVSWRTPNATQAFEFWAYQRSDGGNASISFDNGPETVFDFYNESSGRPIPGDPPVLLYNVVDLSPEQHTVRIKNLFDSRGTINLGYGQLNVDHFVILPVDPGATSSSTTPSAPLSTSSTSPTSSSRAAPTSSTQSGTPTAKPSGSSDYAGAIAGGVVGGIAGLALIAVALFLFMRRGRSKGSASPLSPLMASDTTDATATPPHGGVVPPIGVLYNPNDPRTYPPPPTPAPPATELISHTHSTPEL